MRVAVILAGEATTAVGSEGPHRLLLGTSHGDTRVRFRPIVVLELDLLQLWLEEPAEPGTAP